MKIKTYIVDVFTDEPFKGNPAGVCILTDVISDDLMQNIATEMNLSETAFIRKVEDDTFTIRYFTPTTEIDFCGHATFGSATLLLTSAGLEKVKLITGKSLLLEGYREDGRTVMKFPVFDPQPVPHNSGIMEALGLKKIVAYEYSAALSMALIEIEDMQQLRRLTPDFVKLLQADKTLQEIVVTARSADDKYDFYSRCFCPWIGIDEDPVTGAAHCLLAPYWQRKLQKNSFKAFQCSRRGGYLNLELKDEFLFVKSNAHVILDGYFNL